MLGPFSADCRASATPGDGGQTGVAQSVRVTQKQTRRWGDALEQAILHAAWNELGERGWAGFTIEAVAARCGTGKAAIYKRWSNKVQLAQALLARATREDTTAPQPSGDLRADLEAYLDSVAGFLAGPYGEAVRGVLSEGDQLSRSALELRLTAEPVTAVQAIVTAAIERGDLHVKPDAAVLNLGQVLLSHEMLQTRTAPSAEIIATIVNDIWLPALRAAR